MSQMCQFFIEGILLQTSGGEFKTVIKKNTPIHSNLVYSEAS